MYDLFMCYLFAVLFNFWKDNGVKQYTVKHMLFIWL